MWALGGLPELTHTEHLEQCLACGKHLHARHCSKGIWSESASPCPHGVDII